MTRVCLVALLLLEGASALSPACCASRLSVSRVAIRRAALCMCDAEPVTDEAAVEPAAAAVAEAPAAEERAPRGGRKGGNKTPLDQLEVGAEITGTVRSVMQYGAFVDIGSTTDGLIHVSEICNEFVKDANEKLSSGDSITCKIKSVNMEKNQVALTCKDESASPPREGGGRGKQKADLTEFESANATAFVAGTVNSITEYGAFITLKPGVDGLCHISAIQEGGVGKVSDVLTTGQEVQVRIISFDKAKRRIGLSMKPYVEGESESGGGGKRERRGGFGGSPGFGEDDKAFHMTEEELAGLTVEDGEQGSVFEAAFARSKMIAEAKADKKKYKALML